MHFVLKLNYLNSVRAVSLHIDHNWIYYTEDWNAFYSILSEQIRSYESDLITNSMWHEPT